MAFVTVLQPKIASNNVLGRAPHNVTAAATDLNSATDRNEADGVSVLCAAAPKFTRSKLDGVTSCELMRS